MLQGNITPGYSADGGGGCLESWGEYGAGKKGSLFIDGRGGHFMINDGSPLPSYFFLYESCKKEPTYNEKQESREQKKSCDAGKL